MTTRRHALFALPACALLVATRGAQAVDPSAFSEAEKLIFTEDHFKSLPPTAARLEYEYRKRGTLETEFVDRAVVAVSARNRAGARAAKVEFLTGARKMELPDVKEAEGNPLILYFLEREVREMQRLTGGNINYYRKRIRIGFAEGAQVKSVTLTVGGKQVPATEIHIAPYREDPARQRYEKFAEKTFVFAFSDQVPGGIVEFRTELLEPVAGGEPKLLLAESLKYTARR